MDTVLTHGDQEAIVAGEGQCRHVVLVVGEGLLAERPLDVPQADLAGLEAARA